MNTPMNTPWIRTLVFVLVMTSFVSASAHAKPERHPIKSAEKITKERAAKANLKNVDLQRIEDPESRKAIREILQYLNLQAKG